MKMCECSRISFSCDYTLYGKVSYALPEYGVIMEKEDFATDRLEFYASAV